MKLTETLTVVVIVGILAGLSIPTVLKTSDKAKVNTAIAVLAQQFRAKRLDFETGTRTVCIRSSPDRKVTEFSADSNCQVWQTLGAVEIDTKNTTFRTVAGIAGKSNSGIYRASWGDTVAGYGGSWGQLGRITITSGSHSACLFLNNVEGDFVIRYGNSCNR